MTKNYSLWTALATVLLAAGVQAQNAKPVPTAAELRAQLPGLTLNKPATSEFRGGGGDECITANVLTVGETCAPQTFDAAAATQSQAAILCNGFTSTTANDLWFSFVANSQTTTVTVVGQGNYDAVLEYFSGSCGNLVSLGCTDATFPPNSTTETGSISTVPGTTYYVRVYYYTTPVPTNFQFSICVVGNGGVAPPPNDECTGAVAQDLEVGQTVTFSGDNTGANLLAGTNFVVVWEAFTLSSCATVTLNYCLPGFVYENFLVNVTTTCPDITTGLIAGDATDCEVTFAELPAGTYYIPVLVDPAATPVGPYSLSATAVACPEGYCSAGATSTSFEKIGNVTFADINNNSTATAGYEDFTSIVGNVDIGASYAFNLTITEPYEDDQVLVWIDLDQSETFEENELVFSTTPPQVDANVSGTIVIPAGALAGQTRMRIRLHDSALGGNPTPCGTSTYGQVEDYTLNLTDTGINPPPNDECTGAVAQDLEVGQTVTFSGNNTGANLLAGTNFVVVWEAFTLSTCATVTVNYCVPGFIFENFLLNLTTTCPDILPGLVTGTGTDCDVTFLELPAGTYYIPVLVDPASTPVGDYTISASAVACPEGYCSAGATSTSFEKIGNVTFAGINNSSTATAGYEDFTSIVTDVERGANYAFNLTITQPYEDDQVLVWIDLDQSESFEESELVFSTTPPQPDANVSGTITIPVDAAIGQTRMRVRLHDSALGGNATPCGNSTYGQVEDYTVNVLLTTGVNDATGVESALFPNPNDGNFSVRYGADATVVLEVMDMTGRLVYTEQRRTVSNEVMQLSLAGRLAAGTYVLRMSSELGRSEQRMVVK